MPSFFPIIRKKYSSVVFIASRKIMIYRVCNSGTIFENPNPVKPSEEVVKMITALYVVIGTAFLLALVLALRGFIRNYVKWRGERLVTCPETEKSAGVVVNAKHAAVTAALGDRDLTLNDCTRWPERRNCGQACLAQIESAPEGCLVRNILQGWYRGKSCIYCGRKFQEIHWHDHKPALRDRKGDFLEWVQVPADQLSEVLQTHDPVCWNCFIAENFRRVHPELVTDRPQKTATWH